jgi:hypothetical protein
MYKLGSNSGDSRVSTEMAVKQKSDKYLVSHENRE